MKIGVLGTGVVGRTIAGALASDGHEVAVGTRDPTALLASTEANQMTLETFAEWYEDHTAVALMPFAEAAEHGEVVFNATAGSASLDALAAASAANLEGKILIDVSNPRDFSHGMPPILSVCNTDSLAEQIQRTFPGAKVVKALNTVTAALMVNAPMLAEGDHTMPIAGDDGGAKSAVAGWLREWFGWRDVLDLGDLSAARSMEMHVLMWLRMFNATGTPIVNIKVVR